MSAREFQAVHCVETPVRDESSGSMLFQAVSSGTVPQMRTVVERCLAAEPDQDENERHPLSLIHAHDDSYVTARGAVYSVDGDGPARFTHSLVTNDPVAYGAVRPAQLWRAACWTDKPANSSACDSVAAEPDPGPLHADALREWVRATPEGESWLLALHSALDNLDGPRAARVVFVGDDATEVLRWIATATLLMPQERALRVGFRVFSGDPNDRRYEVVAVSPENAGGLVDPDHAAGLVVFNLLTRKHTHVTATTAAGYWVGRFIDGDPYGVVSGVDLAHRFARDRGKSWPDSADQHAAAVLALGEAPNTDADLRDLVEWLRGAPDALPPGLWEPVLDAVLTANPERDVLHRLADADLGDRAARLWLAMLRVEISRARDASEGVGGEVPLPAELDWSEQDAEQAVDMIERALNSTEPERVDALLRIAAQFGVTPRLERVGPAMGGFVRWWADRPRAGFDPGRWTCGTQLVELLRHELLRRFESGQDGSSTADAVRRHWWRVLLPVVRDPATELDALVLRTAVAAGDAARAEAINICRNLLAKSESHTDVSGAWNALFQDVTPTVAEMAEVLSAMPSSAVTEALAEQVFQVLDGASVTPGLLDVLRLVVHHAGPEHEQLRQLWQQDGRLRHWLGGLQRTGEIPGSGAAALQSVPESVLSARAPELCAAALDVPLEVAYSIATGGGATVEQVLARELPDAWHDEGIVQQRRDHAVALAFAIAWSDSAPDAVRRAMDAELGQWAATHQQMDYLRVHRLLRVVDSEGAAAWQEWIRELSRKPRWARPTRARGWLRKLVNRDG